ncbi:MAG TPA: glycoside hydrolase family 2 TIM barrel-domain containing protein, partial [Polyangiaceae bacterium]|nr:glycoside hydrolase family 2 TIM barrel-domain containing protein [Polyangiaceae bacterium]
MRDHSDKASRRQFLTMGGAALATLALMRSKFAFADVEALRQAWPTSRVDASRLIHLLDGTWDFLPSSGTPSYPPPVSGWSTIPVPGEWNMTASAFSTEWGAYDVFQTPADWNEVETAWYRRTVRVPEARRGQRIVLRFEAVNFEATVFWNGVQVAHNLDGMLPFEADVTDHVVFDDDNTIHVLVRSPASAAKQADGYHYPAGSWYGQNQAGIWQDVWLLGMPAVHTSNTVVRTSVRQNQLSGSSTLHNSGAAAATTWIEHSVGDGCSQVWSHTQQVDVPAGADVEVPFSTGWSNPRLWGPDHPHLYELRVELRTSAHGAALDTTATRFGFREVWIDGDTIYLNGAPLVLRGDAWHYMGSVQNSRAYAMLWFQLAKAAGVNYVRLHAMPYPPIYYEVADEMGMLVVGESAVYGSAYNYPFDAADFWDNCRNHVANRVLRDRNHPSIIFWSVSNEMLPAAGEARAPQVATFKNAAQTWDTTRPIYFEGDIDPNGAADIYSWHYPYEATSNTALPDVAYDFAPGRGQASRWDRKKPLTVGEFGAMYYGSPRDLACLGGSDTYADLDGLWSANALATRAQIEGFRYAGVNGISPWNTVWYGMRPLPFDGTTKPPTSPDGTGPELARVGRYAITLNPGYQSNLPKWETNPIHDAVAHAFRPIAAIATDYHAHYWAEDELTKTLAVHNDTAASASLTVEWSLHIGHGEGRSGQQVLTVAAAGHTDITASVATPGVSAITAGTWQVTVSVGGHPVFTESRPVTLYPKSLTSGTLPGGIRAAVLEPSGTTTTSQVLNRLGVQTRTLSDLSQAPDVNELLVVAEGGDYAANCVERGRITSFVSSGGRVLVLAQHRLPQVFPWLVFTLPSAQTIAHRRAPHHPALAEIGANDLRWWQTDRERVADTFLLKPRAGSFQPLVDGGGQLAGTALAEIRYGSGTYIGVQHPVIAAFDAEPVAALLLRNVLGYLGGRPSTPARRLGSWTGSSSAVPSTLRAAYIDSTALGGLDGQALSGIDVLLVDAAPGNESALDQLNSNASAVFTWLNNGGTLWINGAQPSTLGQLVSLLPAGAQLTPVDHAHSYGAVNAETSPLTDGISNADLDWTNTGPSLVNYTFTANGGEALVTTRAVDWARYNGSPEQTKTAEAT